MFDKAAPPFHANFLVELYEQTGSSEGLLAQPHSKRASISSGGTSPHLPDTSAPALTEPTFRLTLC